MKIHCFQEKRKVGTNLLNIFLYFYLLKFLFAQVYNFWVNQLNRVEIQFTNPIEIDLKINSIELLAETSESNKIRLKLFDDKENTSFVLHSLTDYKLEMGFIFEQLGQFKIIGILRFILFAILKILDK